MRCCLVFSLQELLYANSLACKEDEYAAGGHHEEETTAELVTHESSQNCPEKVPYGEDAINEQLHKYEFQWSVAGQQKTNNTGHVLEW